MKSASYNKIAYDYHLKRKKPWKALLQFLDYLNFKGYSFKGITIDLGCANGRHFTSFISYPDVKIIGIDNSLEFLKIAYNKIKDSELFSIQNQNNIQFILADLRYFPIRRNSVNNIFSIASLHHIEMKTERQGVLCQIFDSLREKGYFLVTVWRRWQKRFRWFFIKDWIYRKLNPYYKRRQIKKGLTEFGDKSLPWTLSGQGMTYNRFYHFFSKQEIKKSLKIFRIKEIQSLGGPNNKDNFFILTQKENKFIS